MRGARVSVSQPRTLLSRQTVTTSRRHHTDSSSLHRRCVYPPISLFCNDSHRGYAMQGLSPTAAPHAAASGRHLELNPKSLRSFDRKSLL